LTCGLRLSLYFLLLVAAVLAIFGFFASRPGVDISDLDLLEPDELVLARFNNRLDAVDELVRQSKQTGQPEPVQLVVSELELTSKLAEWSSPGILGITFFDSHATLRDGEMVLVGKAKAAGVEFRYRADIVVSIESAELQLEVRRLQTGQLFTPGPVRAGLVGLIARALDAGVPRPPIDIETLLISEGEMIISGSARGI